MIPPKRQRKGRSDEHETQKREGRKEGEWEARGGIGGKRTAMRRWENLSPSSGSADCVAPPSLLFSLCLSLCPLVHSADSLSSCHDLVLEMTMALPIALIQSSFSDSEAATIENTISDEYTSKE